jgi:hypothetical protein
MYVSLCVCCVKNGSLHGVFLYIFAHNVPQCISVELFLLTTIKLALSEH